MIAIFSGFVRSRMFILGALLLSTARPALSNSKTQTFPETIGELQPPPTAAVSGGPIAMTNIPPGATLVSSSQFGTVSASGSRNSLPAQSSTTASPASAQPGVGACTAFNVANTNNGPVVSAPRVNLLFWGSWDATTANNLTARWQNLGSAPALYSRTAEYGISAGSFGQRLPDFTSGATGSQPDCVFAGGLSSTLSSIGYTPASNDIFIILLSSNTSSKLDSDKHYGAHHGSYAFSGWGPALWNYTDSTCSNNANGACSGATYSAANQTCTSTATRAVYSLKVAGRFYNLRYAVIEYAPPISAVISHELAETTTDPDGGSYIPEIGDICAGNSQYNFMQQYNFIEGVEVQKIWSQAACRCVGERDPNLVGLGGAASVPTVYRPSNQTVWPDGSPYYFNVYPPGSPVSPFAWDHDGDGFPDYAAFYGAANASISTRLSLPPYYENTYSWGTTGDRIVPGDYDGDGLSDLARWQPSNGTWYVQYSSTGATVSQQWGLSTDIPYPGDFDGDGKTDYAVLRVSTYSLYVIPSSNPGSPWGVWFGGLVAGDIATPGDYNGDGITDFAWWHPATGTWNVWYLGTNTAWTMGWGMSGDVPVARDYDGDWMTDLAYWRPSNGTWNTINSTTWSTTAVQWGASTDIPVQRFTVEGGF